MAQISVEIAKNLVEKLVDPVINEARYLCCFNSYAENFDQKQHILTAKLKDVETEIEKASGVSRVKIEAQQWANEATDLIKVDTKAKKKFFPGLCPNCWWQYRRGKELEEKTLQIDQLLGRHNFDIVAGPADLPGIKYHSLVNFIPFESRKSTVQALMQALEDEGCNMIGLHGLGGTGKTSLAIEVAAKLEGSKFDKVIFLLVSNTPDFKKIRGQIARHLNLNLNDVEEEEHSKIILSTIADMKEKLLIILDDVWQEFDLIKDIGIPSGHQHKGFSVLITTRNSRVCTVMGCESTIQLGMLTNEDALDLFLAHASIDRSFGGLMSLARKIVNQCGGVPVAIVAIARTLKGQPLPVWREALKTLEKRDVNQNLSDVYYSLSLSYDNLESKMAKELFLISSLFPEGYEIPIEFLSKIGIGLGLSREDDKYHSTRSNVLEAIQELEDSSLLLKVEEEHVKMHDLVREAALTIGREDIQSIIDRKMPIKDGLRYLFWMNDDFLNVFDGKELEILLIFLDGSSDLNVPHTFFEDMTRLKILFLMSTSLISAPSLSHSLQWLKDIRILTLANLKLDDISTLENLLCLEILWLRNCSIIEIPKELLKLKLRSLEVEGCKIEMNNPFAVIEGCSQLEELTFVHNQYDKERIYAISEDASLPTIHRYQISSNDLSYYFKMYGSMLRCFWPDDLRHLVSEATFKQLVGKAELLMLGGYEETRWGNIIPDIVSVDGGGMNDVIILHLYSWPSIRCLINTESHYSKVIAFSNLVELSLYKMDVENLCHGPLSSGSLMQLEIMKLEDCPMLTSIFQPSTLQNLMKLKELIIKNCNALQCLDDGDTDKESYDPLFPKLRTLQIAGCDKLKTVLRVNFGRGFQSLEEISIRECKQLEYIFDKFQGKDHFMLSSLKQMEFFGVPSLIGINREYQKPKSTPIQNPSSQLSSLATRVLASLQACCFLNKSEATSEETNFSKERLFDHAIPQELNASTNVVPPFQVAQSLPKLPAPGTSASSLSLALLLAAKEWFAADHAYILPRQLLKVRHIRKMNLANLSLNSTSFSTLSVASFILWKELTIINCHGLKHIITSEEDHYSDQINYISIFPMLERLEIEDCKDLEILYPSSISLRLKNLKFLIVTSAPKLRYISGKLSSQNKNDELHFHVPTLEVLSLEDVPKFTSICAMNCHLASPSLENVVLKNCGIKSFTNLMVCSDEDQLNQKTAKKIQASINKIKEIKLVDCSNLISVLTLPVASSTILLENLTIERCQQLKCIVADKGDAGALMNHNSIFPKLKELRVSECGALEYLFPAFAFRFHVHLKTLIIHNTPELKYVFGRSHHEDNLSHENQNMCPCIDFPALQQLHLKDVRSLVSICPKNCYLRVPSPNSIHLELSSEIEIRSISDFMVCGDARQQDSTTTKVTEEEIVEIVEEDDISEKRKMTISTFNSKYTGQLVTEDEITEIVEEDDISEMEKMTTSTFESNYIGQIGEVKDEGDNNSSETLHSSPNLTVRPNRDSNPMTSKSMEEKQEEGGGLIINASSSLPKEKRETFVSGDPFVPPTPIILNEQTFEAIRPPSPLTSKASTSTLNQTPPSSLSNSTNEEDFTAQSVSNLTKDSSICPSDSTHGRNIQSGVETTNQRTPEVVDDVQVSDMPQAPAIVSVQDESGANVASHGNEVNSSRDVRVDPSPLTRRAEESLYSRGQIVEHHDSTEPNIEDSQSSLPPFSAPEEMATSLLQTNQASTVTGVQEIVDMMKLEGFEPSILAKALETHPQLILPVNERRSTRVLSLSYRVLLDILNILSTRTPFTITEADRRLLEEHLNDAYFLGFDKDWLDSIKTRVFDCDTSEVDDIQKVLKSLDNDLKTNEEELAAIRDEEVEAARVVDAAEQEHANVMARHSRLLKARQDILARRQQCWEKIVDPS